MDCPVVTALKNAGYNINIQGTPENPLFQANQIGELLDISTIRSSIRNFSNDSIVFHTVQTTGGNQSTSFFTLKGLQRVVANSRKSKALAFAHLLGVDVLPCKVSTFEAATLCQIINAFQGEEMFEQFAIDSFRIDLYFPKFKLAIECDENGHDKNIVKDLLRQQQIEDKLNCRFIRYQPHIEGFCIFKVINQIYRHIQDYQC